MERLKVNKLFLFLSDWRSQDLNELSPGACPWQIFVLHGRRGNISLTLLNPNLRFTFSFAGDDCIRDIALLLDSSNSISPSNFWRLKAFAVSLIDAFDVKANGSHMAIISYSDYPRLEAGFDTFTGAELDNGSLILTVDNMTQMEGTTYIDRALNFTNEEVFQVENGMREEVKKVIKRQTQNWVGERVGGRNGRKANSWKATPSDWDL